MAIAGWILTAIPDFFSLEVGLRDTTLVEKVMPFIEEKKTAPADRFLAGSPGDADGDGMSDTWETSYHLDPNDPADANSDFDRDGLTALQESQFGTSPLGEWREDPIAFGTGIIKLNTSSYKKFTDSGFVLLGGASANTSADPSFERRTS